MTVAFITSASALAGNPLPVIVCDGDGNPVDSSMVVWSGLPSTAMVSADPDVPGRFVFTCSATTGFGAKAMIGAATATIVLNFQGLKFLKG